MAFSSEEMQIIEWSKQNGKSVQEMKDAIFRFRTTGSPIDPSKPVLSKERSFGADVALGAAKGLGATAKLLAEGIASSPIGVVDLPGMREAQQKAVTSSLEHVGLTDENLKTENQAQMIGKGLEIGAEFLAPLGIAKGANLVRKGLSLSGEGGIAAKEIAEGIGTYASGRLPKLLGIFTGESDDVIRAALRNPSLADKGIEGGDVALRKAIQEGSENTIKIRNTFLQAHKQAKQKVLGQYGGILEPRNNVVGIFNKLLEKNGVKLTEDGLLDFTTSRIIANPGEVKKINDAYAALKQWDKFTLDSLDDYKQLVGRLTKFADEAGLPSKSPFLGSLYHELNQIAMNRLPKEVAKEYASLNKNFSENIELYDDLVDAFNSGDPFVKLANALGKNKDTLRQVLDFYAKQEGGQDVLPIVAGRELAMEKTAAFGFLNPRSWIDLLISPEKQAKITTRVGRFLSPNQRQ